VEAAHDLARHAKAPLRKGAALARTHVLHLLKRRPSAAAPLRQRDLTDITECCLRYCIYMDPNDVFSFLPRLEWLDFRLCHQPAIMHMYFTRATAP